MLWCFAAAAATTAAAAPAAAAFCFAVLQLLLLLLPLLSLLPLPPPLVLLLVLVLPFCFAAAALLVCCFRWLLAPAQKLPPLPFVHLRRLKYVCSLILYHKDTTTVGSRTFRYLFFKFLEHLASAFQK